MLLRERSHEIKPRCRCAPPMEIVPSDRQKVRSSAGHNGALRVAAVWTIGQAAAAAFQVSVVERTRRLRRLLNASRSRPTTKTGGALPPRLTPDGLCCIATIPDRSDDRAAASNPKCWLQAGNLDFLVARQYGHWRDDWCLVIW